MSRSKRPLIAGSVTSYVSITVIRDHCGRKPKRRVSALSVVFFFSDESRNHVDIYYNDDRGHPTAYKERNMLSSNQNYARNVLPSLFLHRVSRFYSPPHLPAALISRYIPRLSLSFSLFVVRRVINAGVCRVMPAAVHG